MNILRMWLAKTSVAEEIPQKVVAMEIQKKLAAFIWIYYNTFTKLSLSASLYSNLMHKLAKTCIFMLIFFT